jgi:hypothetical protein
MAGDPKTTRNREAAMPSERPRITHGTGPTFGTDGVIPIRYRGKIHSAIATAWQLSRNARFLDTFRKTVGGLSYRTDLPPEVYASALNSMTLNFAETARNPLARKEVQGVTHLEGSLGPAPAFTSVPLGQTWLREFLLKDDYRRIAGVLMHESAHYAGAPGDPLAEIALSALDRVAGLPR